MKQNKFIWLIVIFMLSGCETNYHYDGEVNVLNWSSYIPDSVIHGFEDEYHIYEKERLDSKNR